MSIAPVRIDAEINGRACPILIEAGLIDRAGEALAPYAAAGRLIIVSDETVWAAQGRRLTAGLAASGIQPVPVLVPPGEDSKSWPVFTDLIDRLLEAGIERREHLAAFGGGMIGDLGGFAAAVVKRGCSYVQIPTSLLAQADSAVGGKTGINVRSGKNLVGAFHQPSAVLIDPTCLDTLLGRQVRAGYAEVVKYGLIGDADFFGWCESHGDDVRAGDPAARQHAITKSITAKVAVVQEDPFETGGARSLLNLGHTFGHALEAETGFSDRLLHGEAVALGMVLAFRFSVERGLCDAGDAERVAAHFDAVGLPTRLGHAGLKADGGRLAGRMAHDKKGRGGRVPFVLARGIGHAFLDWTVSLDDVALFLDRELQAT